MAAELPRPGVEVIQVFRSVSPTVITPTLVPCVVGVCKQIVDALVVGPGGGTQLNPDALVTLPGFFVAAPGVGSPPKYSGLDGLHLDLSVNSSPPVVVTFSDPTAIGLSPAAMRDQINAALAAADVTSARTELVGTTTFRVRTVGVGDFQQIEVFATSSGAVLSALGLGPKTFYGLSAYNAHQVNVPPTSFPDPRLNMSQLAILDDSIRVFLSVGNGALAEVSRTRSFLRRGAGVTYPAVLTGTQSLSFVTTQSAATLDGGDLSFLTGCAWNGNFRLTINGTLVTITVSGAPFASVDDFENLVNAQILAQMGSQAASMNVGCSMFRLITTATGVTATLKAEDGTGGGALYVTDLGLTSGTEVTGSSFHGDFALDVDGTSHSMVISGASGTISAFLIELNAQILSAFGSQVATATEDVNHYLILTTASTGAAASLSATDGSGGSPISVSVFGYTSGAVVHGTGDAIAVIDDGNGDAMSPLVQLSGNLTAGASAAVLTGSVTVAGVTTALRGKTLTLSDGRQPQSIVFSATLNTDTEVLTAINDVMGVPAGGGLTASLSTGFLRLTSSAIGDEGQVRVEGGAYVASGDAAYILGLATLAAPYPVVTRGTPFPVAAGDELYVDGAYVGVVLKVAPGGLTNTVKVDKQLPINPDFGSTFYIIAVKLTGAATATRPSSDLQIGLDGAAQVKHELLRDTIGAPMLTRAPVYLSYSAIRKDVSAQAANPGLLRFSSTTEVEALLAPINIENPLALGLYFALLNAPGSQVTGLGVSAVSDDAPYGTVEAYAFAAQFLEAYEVYGIAPMTHDSGVAQVFSTHVTVMSAPENKGERICVFNLPTPTKKLDELVASGRGNTVGSTGTTFDTGVASLTSLLLAAGLDPTSTIPASAGLFLDIASSALRYSVASVSGSQIVIRNTFAVGENTDGFYATSLLNTPPLPAQLINELFSLKIRGVSLTLPDGSPDKVGMAETLQGTAQGYLNRRFWNVVPDRCAATLDGLEQVIEGFYMAAAIVGMIAQNKPQQSFTNFPMSGFTRVVGSNEFFSERQLNVVAAGGNYIIVQDAQGAPLTSRMALTTDMTSIETRTDSITKVVDFTAKFLRRGLRNFIGRFNITQGFLDSLGHVIGGLLGFLEETGVLIGSHLNNLIQDANAPDTVLVDITLDVPYPCNYIRLTLVI